MTQEQITALLAQAYAQLAQRDARLAQRDAQLAQRDAQLVQKDAQLAQKDAQLLQERKEKQESDALHKAEVSFHKAMGGQSASLPVLGVREQWYNAVKGKLPIVSQEVILEPVPKSDEKQVVSALPNLVKQHLPAPLAYADTAAGTLVGLEREYQTFFAERVVPALNHSLQDKGRVWCSTAKPPGYLYSDPTAPQFGGAPDGSLLAINFAEKPHACGLYAVLEFRPTKNVSSPFAADDLTQTYGYLQRMAMDPVRGDSRQPLQHGDVHWFYGALTDFRRVRYMRICRDPLSITGFVIQLTEDIMLIDETSEASREKCEANRQRFVDFLLWDFGVDLALRRLDGSIAADVLVDGEYARSHRSVVFTPQAKLSPADGQIGNEPLIKVVAANRGGECKLESEIAAALALRNLPNMPVLRVATQASKLVGGNFVVLWPRHESVHSVRVNPRKRFARINFATAIRTVAHIHNQNYVHRDLRQPNIVLKCVMLLMGGSMHDTVVIDYATAVRCDGRLLPYTGLPMYWSREMFEARQSDAPRIDAYAYRTMDDWECLLRTMFIMSAKREELPNDCWPTATSPLSCYEFWRAVFEKSGRWQAIRNALLQLDQSARDQAAIDAAIRTIAENSDDKSAGIGVAVFNLHHTELEVLHLKVRASPSPSPSPPVAAEAGGAAAPAAAAAAHAEAGRVAAPAVAAAASGKAEAGDIPRRVNSGIVSVIVPLIAFALCKRDDIDAARRDALEKRLRLTELGSALARQLPDATITTFVMALNDVISNLVQDSPASALARFLERASNEFDLDLESQEAVFKELSSRGIQQRQSATRCFAAAWFFYKNEQETGRAEAPFGIAPFPLAAASELDDEALVQELGKQNASLRS
jgi:hypothetical protein